MPTSSCGLSSSKNARLSQRFAGLSQRFAVRRAFGSQKSRKCLEILRNFSWQGYASDLRSRQSLLTTSAQLAGDVPYHWQAPSCCVAFVLLGVRGAHILCTIRPNLRQNYKSIAAHLSDKSQMRSSLQRERRHASLGLIGYALTMSCYAGALSAGLSSCTLAERKA